MSKYYKNYSRKRYYSNWYDHTFNSYTDSVKSFLRNEFFLLDKTSLNTIGIEYKKKHGFKAYDYFVETYYKWKDNTVRMSDQTMDRLLKFVPKILSTEKKYHLLKLEIISFIEKNIQEHKSDIISIEEIDNVYLKYLDSIYKFDENNLRWFVKDIFEIKEIKDYVNFSKYVLLSKADLSLKSVVHDIKIINHSILSIEKIYSRVFYVIDLLGVKVSIEGKCDFNSKVIIKNSDLSDSLLLESSSKKHMLNEILELNFLTQNAQTNGIIQEKDLKLLGDSINKLNSQNKEYVINSKLMGRGGVLDVNIEFIPKSKIIISIVVHSLIIFGSLLVIISIIYIFFKNIIPKNLRCVVFGGGLIFILYTGYFIIEQVKKLRSQTFYLKNHY